jgi:hypothetical protein
MKENYKLFHALSMRGYDTLLTLLNKAEAHIKENNIAEADLLGAKLYEDMFDFTRQVQIFTDATVGGVYRVAGLEKPSMPDTEKTLAELVARVNTAKATLEKVNPDTVELDEKRQISLKWMPAGSYFEAKEYLENFLFMNSMFHLTVAYAILRNKGVKLGKMDFLGKVEMKFNA